MIKLISSMLIFGTVGLFRRFIPLSSAALACIRGLIGSLFLACCIIARGGSLRFGFTKKQTGLLCLTGAVIGANWILLFEAYNYTSIAVATLCYYMQPTIVILLSPFLFGEKLTPKKWVCVLISIVGIVFVSGVAGSGNGVSIVTAGVTGFSGFKGILLGLGAAMLYAAAVIMNKKNPMDDAYGKTFVQILSAAAVLVPYIFLTGGPGSLRLEPKALIMLIILGVFHTGLAYVLYFGSMKDLDSQTVAIMSYIDPIFAVIVSAVFLKEPMTGLAVIGAVMIVGAAILSEK